MQSKSLPSAVAEADFQNDERCMFAHKTMKTCNGLLRYLYKVYSRFTETFIYSFSVKRATVVKGNDSSCFFLRFYWNWRNVKPPSVAEIRSLMTMHPRLTHLTPLTVLMTSNS